MFIFACPKTNQKGQPFTWPRFAGLPCAAQNNRALRNSSANGGLKQSSRYSGYFSAARLREMALKNLSGFNSRIF
jgi:hypothetical protein